MVKPKPKFKSKGGRIRNPRKISRWAKGDSCLSNPEVTKFRDEASSLYFHQVVKNPLLTEKNLGGRNFFGEHELDEDVLSADVQSLTVSDARSAFSGSVGSYNTYKTFASNWSKCSNGAFERFLGRFKLDSALHKEMLSILAATTEVINGLGGTHRETEYFASFVTTLDQCDPSQYQAMMALLSIISGRVPEAVIRKTFSTVHPKLAMILGYAIENFDSGLMRVTCDVLKKILGAQDPSVFEIELPVQSLIYGILKCSLHENPKVRRKARQTIGFILSRQKEKTGQDAVAKIVMGWILDQLSTYPTCGPKSAGDAVGLLQFVWSNIDRVPVGGGKKLYESILRVMSSGDISLIKIGFSFFTVAFQTHIALESSSSKPEVSLTPKLIAALWEFAPDWRNNDTFLLWLQCMLNGLIRLAEEEIHLAGPYISRLLEAITPTWNSSWGTVPSKVFTEYLFHIIRPEMRIEDVDACFVVLSKQLIAIPPNENCLAVLTGFMEPLKPDQFTTAGREVFLQLLQLRNSAAAQKITPILGRFVKSFGVDNLWISVAPEFRHTVILPLLKDNLSGGQLAYWKKEIFPLIKTPQFVHDVWGSLVGFCRDPTDPENFPAELVGNTILNKPTYRLLALTALKQLALWRQSQTTLQKYANNYLPLLFNLYVNERQAALTAKKLPSAEMNKADIAVNMGHSDAVGKTIQEYLSHLQAEAIQCFMETALSKYKCCKKEERGPILDLITFLSSFQMDVGIYNQIYEITVPIALDDEHMKKGYRILLSILKNEYVPKETKTSVMDLLRKSKGKTKSNAEPLRLDCINYLAFQNDEWMNEFLPEAILCLLSVNTNGRKVANKFVNQFCEALKEKKISVENLDSVVRLGLSSENSFIISCTIHFLVRVYLQIPPNHPDESLINICINHLLEVEKWDPAVCREALTFLSLNLSIYKSEMGLFAGSLGKVLQTPVGLPRKEMNKILARMIRVFGVRGLRAVLPNPDEPKMNTRIKNIQRKLRKLKEKVKGEKEKEQNSEESDEDDEDDDPKSRRSHRAGDKLIIKEGVVDFLDPKNMAASLISKPEEKKDENFKLSEDGKLIIEDLQGEKRGRKRSLEKSFDGKNSDEDDEDELEGKRSKQRPGRSIASSKHSMRTNRTTGSKRSVKSRTSVGSKSGGHRSQARLQLKAKHKKGSTAESVRSGKSTRSKASGKSSERFNYKR